MATGKRHVWGNDRTRLANWTSILRKTGRRSLGREREHENFPNRHHVEKRKDQQQQFRELMPDQLPIHVFKTNSPVHVRFFINQTGTQKPLYNARIPVKPISYSNLGSSQCFKSQTTIHRLKYGQRVSETPYQLTRVLET